MVASRIRLSSIPPVGGLGLGVVLALAVLFMPAPVLDDLVAASGLGGLVAGAEPPVGTAGRLTLALGLGVGVGAVGWAALFLLFGTGGVFAREGGQDGMPQVRRADAHPDAPPRKPLSAADLPERDPIDEDEGPLPIAGPAAPIERPIPADLDQPLAEFDPRAIPAAPLEPVRPVAPLAAPPPVAAKTEPLAPGERIDSVELSPRHAAEAGAPSVEALLARLERGTMLHQRRMGRAS